MKFIFFYFFSLIAFITQINLESRGLSLPLFAAVTVFSCGIIPFWKSITISLILSLCSDLISPNPHKISITASIPLILLLYIFNLWKEKNKPDKLKLLAASAITLSIYYTITTLISLLSSQANILLLIISMPVFIITSILFIVALMIAADILQIKEEEKMVFS